MSHANESNPTTPRRLRLWPAGIILLLAAGATIWVRLQHDWAFQKRNLVTYEIVIVAVIALTIWWTFLSRATTRLRLTVTFGAIGLCLIGAALFRVRGMSGDLLPILEFRWANRQNFSTVPATSSPVSVSISNVVEANYPQFLGPDRNGVLSGPVLEKNWSAHSPEIIWKKNVGAAWSGFVVVNGMAITQEQRAEQECVVAYDLLTGRELWVHADAARFDTVIAGQGPRATPTVSGERVFTLGATGILNCLELQSGRRVWSRNVVEESGGKIPQWGCAGSPLVVNDLVLVHGGEAAQNSIFAFKTTDGALAWSDGEIKPCYASLSLATFAGEQQVVAFNDGSVSGHDLKTGATLWERPWGNGNVVCSSPVIINERRILFSSGYGVGAELLEISRTEGGKWAARLVWKSIRMKAKFAHLYARDGFLYGLDDGIFACVDLKDGALRWKEGRYGHGQGLLVGDFYLLMSESGELVLLQPDSRSANELARFRVFEDKTWNPIALAGELLLVRNDREASCVRLPLAETSSPVESAQAASPAEARANQ